MLDLTSMFNVEFDVPRGQPDWQPEWKLVSFFVVVVLFLFLFYFFVGKNEVKMGRKGQSITHVCFSPPPT